MKNGKQHYGLFCLCLLPRKGHRQSSSDSPLRIAEFVNSVPQLVSVSDCRNLVSKG